MNSSTKPKKGKISEVHNNYKALYLSHEVSGVIESLKRGSAPLPITSIPEGNSKGLAQKTDFLRFLVTKQKLLYFYKDV